MISLNDEILELKTDFETFYKLIDENIGDKSSPFYDIMNESSKDKVGALMNDLYARFMFIIVQIMISEYQNLLENNAQETRQICTKFLSDQLSDKIENQFIQDTRFGIWDSRYCFFISAVYISNMCTSMCLSKSALRTAS